MTEPIIRRATKDDLPHLQHICDVTAAKSLDAAKDRSIIPAIWCTPYIVLPAGFGFALESSDTGKPIGYIIGTLDTEEFIKQYQEQYIPTLKYPRPDTEEGKKYAEENFPGMEWILSTLYNPHGSMYSELIEEGNKAHLHIDILPEWQSQGFGGKLLKKYEEHVKLNYGSGYHLSKDEMNVRAGEWYLRHGLRKRELKRPGFWMSKEF